MNKRAVLNLSVYSLLHFAIDLTCAWLLLSRVRPQSEIWGIAMLLYNYFAFAMQLPLGILADRINRNSLFASLGCIFVALGCFAGKFGVAAAVLALNGIGFSERLGEFRDVFTGDHCMIQVNAFSAEANTLLPNAGVPTDNALYTALAGYFADMTAISTSGETNQNAIQAQLDKAFSSAADNVGTALSAQYANKSLRDRVISKLIEIFQIPPEEIPSLLGDILPKLSDAGAADDSKDNESENTGGYGSGENLFGSNDIIYHPFGEGGGAYIEYGYALDEYYKKIEELLLEGNLSEETKKIIIDYFARLSNGTKDN